MYKLREHLLEVMLLTCMFSIFILDVGKGDDEQQDIKKPLKKRKLIVKEVSGECDYLWYLLCEISFVSLFSKEVIVYTNISYLYDVDWMCGLQLM